MTAPVRAALLLGGSGAVYAVSLAGMAGLQSRSDGELAARSAPYVEALEATRARNDALDATIRGMDAAARSLAGGYAATADAIAAYEARLDSLASLVAEVQGSAAALPARIALPSVTVRGAGAPAKAPRTSATSGGSGG